MQPFVFVSFDASSLYFTLIDLFEIQGHLISRKKYGNRESKSTELLPDIFDAHVIFLFQVDPEADDLNDKIFDLMLLVRNYKKSKIRKFTLLMPYLPYSRQDQDNAYGRVVLEMLFDAGVDCIVVCDIHNDVIIQGLNVISIPLTELWLDALQKMLKDREIHYIVAPDVGGLHRAQDLALAFAKSYFSMKKIRKNNEIVFEPLPATLGKGGTVLLIDDIIDTGKTAIQAAKLLKENGAETIIGVFAHGLFSHITCHEMKHYFSHVFITDSVLRTTPIALYESVSLASLFVKRLKSIIL